MSAMTGINDLVYNEQLVYIESALKKYGVSLSDNEFWRMKNGKIQFPNFIKPKEESINGDSLYIGDEESVKDNSKLVEMKLTLFNMEEDFTIVPSDEYTIQIDLDTVSGLAAYIKNLPVFRDQIGVTSIEKTISRSERLHIVMKTSRSFTEMERIAIQSALGSDSMRESCNIRNFLIGKKNPILFLEKKDQWEIGA